MRDGNSERNQLPGRPYDAILDSIADGVFTVSADWEITYLNRAGENITGVPRDEAVGRRCSEVLRASVCEENCPLRETIETGRPVVNRTVYIVNADGERVPVSISSAVLRDEEGNFAGGVETFRDLSLVEELRRELEGRRELGDIVSRSGKMERIFEILPRVAESESTVCVRGESGTGKELLARAIHSLSPRSEGPFVAVSCAALPENLLESELFGHVAGAFTDARSDRAGRFEAARGGTIFLDEIGDVPPSLQVRLLRVLQEFSYEPLGSNETVDADVRVVTATNRDLDELVEEGTFRRDLYYRINVVSLTLPPLRERKEDIPLLVDHFINRFNRRRAASVEGVSDAAMAALEAHGYPGNVRELENAVEHAFVLCRGGLIEPEHLPASIAEKARGAAPLASAPATLEEMEKALISRALRRHEGNKTKAAEQLGIHKSTLYRKLDRYGISG